MLQYNLCILMESLHCFGHKKMIFLLDTNGATLIAKKFNFKVVMIIF